MLLCELYGRFKTFRSSLFSATSIILSDGEERDQRGEPYSERQYDFIRKHLTKGSREENLHKTEFALRFKFNGSDDILLVIQVVSKDMP